MKSSTIEKLGNVSNASVTKCTGKSWDYWIQVLDKAGAGNMTHQQIVALLRTRYKLTLWWQQSVTSGYEIHIGRRMPGRTLKGDYSITVTKMFPVTQKVLWKFISSKEGLGVWLKPLVPFSLEVGASFECEGGIFGEVRTLKSPQRIRLRWQNVEEAKPSIVQLNVFAKGKQSMLAIQHENLLDGRLRALLRELWKDAVQRIAENF